MPQNVSMLPVGLSVASQIPLSFNKHHVNEAALADLGANNNLAFVYHKGMVFYCAEEGTRWEWKEVGSQRLLPEHFVYPDPWVVNGIDYSGKSYNFFKISNVTEENLTDYLIIGPAGRGIVGESYNALTGVLTLTFSDSTTYQTDDLRGDNGLDGRSIIGVAYLISSGLNDRYRISFSDNTFFDFSITNGTNGTDGITPIMTRNSVTPNDIANTGSKTWDFTSTPNLGWIHGMRLRMSNDDNKYMEGVITSLGPSTIIVAIDYSVGTGTALAFWSIGIAGDPGIHNNPQKTLIYPGDFPADNYTMTAGDNDNTIYLDNGANNVTITVNASLPAKIITAFVQRGSGLVTFVTSGGAVLNSPTGGLKLKGQFYSVAVEREEVSTQFFLLGNSKI